MSKNPQEKTEDKFLIQSYLAGETEAFPVLYARYKVLLYNYLRHLLSGSNAALDDLFQQTWIRVLDKLPKYRDQQQFSAWLLRIAHNLVIDYYRKNRNMQQYESGSLDDEDYHFEATGQNSEPWRNMSNSELGNAINEALKTLSPDLREVFLLRQEEYSFKEIAAIQNSSVNTVLGRMQYALKNLRKQLAEWKS